MTRTTMALVGALVALGARAEATPWVEVTCFCPVAQETAYVTAEVWRSGMYGNGSWCQCVEGDAPPAAPANGAGPCLSPPGKRGWAYVFDDEERTIGACGWRD